MISIRLQCALLIVVAGMLGAAAVLFVRIKAEQLREFNGDSVVNQQIAEGFSHRSVADLERLNTVLSDDANVTKMIEQALAIKAANDLHGSSTKR